ncbi:hypothetical protein AAHC03_016445 [Spirometra sp. Aus1]
MMRFKRRVALIISILILPLWWFLFRSDIKFSSGTDPIGDGATCSLPDFVNRIRVDQSPVTFGRLEREWGEGASQLSFGLDNQLKLESPYRLVQLDSSTSGEHNLGGSLWSPVDCTARQTVAIIVPFRDRYANLTVFLHHMHPFLRHQKVAYTIFVVEQRGQTTFNRASLLNVGFIEASKRHSYSCFIFHDVDLLPEDDRNLYMCDEEPTHMSATINKFNYKLFYAISFGGAVAMTPDHFRRVHGYANTYYSWGREDDDMSARLGIAGLHLHRRDFAFARYTMLKHDHESSNKPNPVR